MMKRKWRPEKLTKENEKHLDNLKKLRGIIEEQ